MQNSFPFPQKGYSDRILQRTSEDLHLPRGKGRGVSHCKGASSAWEMLMAQMDACILIPLCPSVMDGCLYPHRGTHPCCEHLLR